MTGCPSRLAARGTWSRPKLSAPVGQVDAHGSIEAEFEAWDAATPADGEGPTNRSMSVFSSRQLVDLSVDGAATIGVAFYIDVRDALIMAVEE